MDLPAVSDVVAGTRATERIKINVGGKLFETTASTIQAGGSDSLLAALSSRGGSSDQEEPVFIDRDPEIFSILLSILRTASLPSDARRLLSSEDLAEEALYYGIESILRSVMSPPPLVGVDATVVKTIVPAANAFPTALSAGAGDGSLWIGHGGQISTYDWNLARAGTLRTHLEDITSLRPSYPEVAAIGSSAAPGLHFYNVSGGRHVGSTYWSDPSDLRVSKACVTAITSDLESGDALFAAFESPHWENCILAVDKATLKVVSEIGRQSGSGTKSAAAGKLAYMAVPGLLFASKVSTGAFGYAGYMRLWDPRSGEVVWETIEPGGGGARRFGDPFAGADIDREEGAIYKVCSRSGDVGVADIRKLGDDPWVYLGERNAGIRSAGGGQNSLVHCYKKQVFLSREAGLEVWSQVEDDGEEPERRGVGERSFRWSLVDTEEDARRGVIRRMEGGGDRLFVSRDGMEGVEVWESSTSSGAIPLR